MDHDRTGLSDDEVRAFDELTSGFGEVRVPRVAAAAGAVRGRYAPWLLVVAFVAFVATAPLLAVGVWASFVAFVVAVAAVSFGWQSWLAAARSSALRQRASEFWAARPR